jgi:hypothetical protein
MYSNKTQANRAVFEDYAKPQILKRGRPNYKHIYNKHFLPAFLKLELGFDPITEKTFYVYKDKYIDPDEVVAAQQGRVAAKHAKISKNQTFSGDGFTSRVEVDGYHEPIALLDPITFKPTSVRPIHYLAMECHTGCYVSAVTDYKNKSENSSNVIELYKRMFFPKPDFQIMYGTKNLFRQYLKPYQIFHDGGLAFIANACADYIAFSNTCSGLARTQDAKGKAFVETGNYTIKRAFTWLLPGSYDDKQKDYIDPKHYSTFAVLTTLEHEVLFNRFICDDFNHGFDKRRGFNRGEQWVHEAGLFPPCMPDNPGELINYMGMRDTKKIRKAVGIEFHVRGTPHTFNSDKLQKLRRVLLKINKTDEVVYHRSDFFPDNIRVVNPISDEVLIVPRVKDDEDTEIHYVGDGEFYAELASLQRIEILAAMTNEEIIEAAEKRKRKIIRFKQDKKRQRAKDSKALDDVIAEDTKILKALIAEQSLDEEPSESVPDDSEGNEQAEDIEQEKDSKTSDPDNKPDPKKGWGKPNLLSKSSKD